MRKKKEENAQEKIELEEKNSGKEEESIDIESIKEELASEINEKIDEGIKQIDEKIASFNTDMDNIKDDCSSRIKEQMNEQLNEELNDYMKHKIDKGVSEAIDKANKKIIRHKNSIIIKRDIVIVILLIICFFLGYNLYNISNIKIDIYREKRTALKKVSEKKEEKKEEKVDNDFDEKKKEYIELLKKYSMLEDDPYVKDFYEGNLTEEIKLCIAFNNLDSEKIDSDDDTIYIDGNDLKEQYEKLFDSEYDPKSFKRGSLKFKYLSSKDVYLAEGKLINKKSLIEKEISGIKEDGDLILTVVEGKVSDDKLYNILSDSEISNYEGKKLTEYENSLTKVEYTFKKIDDKYKLSKIEIQ